jgi:hypothetical protein
MVTAVMHLGSLRVDLKISMVTIDDAWILLRMCKEAKVISSGSDLSQNKGLIPPRVNTLDRRRKLWPSRVDAD